MASTRSRAAAKNQRRLSPRRLPSVDLGSVVEQGRDRRDAAGRGRHVQRGHAAGARRRRRVRPERQQQLDDRGPSRRARYVQRRVVTDARHRVHRGAGVNQRLGHLRVAALGGPVQCRHAVAVGGVGVLPPREQGPDRLEVTRPRRIGYRCVRRCGRERGAKDETRGDRDAQSGNRDARTIGCRHQMHRPSPSHVATPCTRAHHPSNAAGLSPRASRWRPRRPARSARTFRCCRRTDPSPDPVTASASAWHSPSASRPPPSGAGSR